MSIKSENRNVVFTNRLKEVCDKYSVSTSELAGYCQVMPLAIEKVIKGEHKPGIVLALQIADYFETDVRDIFDIEFKKSAKERIRESKSRDTE